MITTTSVGRSVRRTLKSISYVLFDYEVYALAWIASRLARIELRLFWFCANWSTADQYAFLMSDGIWSPASYLAIFVATRICAVDFDSASGESARGTWLFGEILPPRLTQIAWASAVVRYFIIFSAWGVSLNIDHASPATTCAPAYCEVMSGNPKKLKSVPGCRDAFALWKKLVMNDAWLCM